MSSSKIAITILAAGGSSRLGRPKQLLEYRGESLIRRIVRSAAEADLGSTIVVTSRQLSDAVSEHTNGTAVEIVINDAWEAGLSSSIRAGLASAVAMEPDLKAVILTLCDQPDLTSDTFVRLANGFRRARRPIVASEYAGTVGVPALFDRSMFADLLALTGDQGAKSLILSHDREVERIEAPEAAFDIDSVGDLEENRR